MGAQRLLMLRGDFEPLASDFQLASGLVRVVFIVSPT